MISKINSQWGGMIVSNPMPTHISMSNPSAGMVRYNMNHFEVYDGYSWISFAQDATVDLTYDTREVLEWASKKNGRRKSNRKIKRQSHCC
jgi:hypothetical protein